jgi:hypothetical protein
VAWQVDNHVHLAAGFGARQLLGFIKARVWLENNYY